MGFRPAKSCHLGRWHPTEGFQPTNFRILTSKRHDLISLTTARNLQYSSRIKDITKNKYPSSFEISASLAIDFSDCNPIGHNSIKVTADLSLPWYFVRLMRDRIHIWIYSSKHCTCFQKLRWWVICYYLWMRFCKVKHLTIRIVVTLLLFSLLFSFLVLFLSNANSVNLLCK